MTLSLAVLSVIMPSVVMLNVIMLCAVMLNVLARKVEQIHGSDCDDFGHA